MALTKHVWIVSLMTMTANELVTNHLHLAELCAKKWRGRDASTEYDDYFQTACLGLIRSSRKYHSNKGKAKFSTYAYRSMDGEVKNMRAVKLTGVKDGLARGYTIPSWEPVEDKMLGVYEHCFDIDIESYYSLEHRIEAIKHRASKHGMAVRLAKHTKLSKETIWLWLRGKRQPSVKRCEQLEAALDFLEKKDKEEQSNKRNRLQYLKDKMVEQRLSITALARKIGVTQPTLSRWLNGDTTPTDANRQRMEQALCILT